MKPLNHLKTNMAGILLGWPSTKCLFFCCFFFICKTVTDSLNSIHVHLNGANETECHDITEILLKVVLSTINQTKQFLAPPVPWFMSLPALSSVKCQEQFKISKIKIVREYDWRMNESVYYYNVLSIIYFWNCYLLIKM